MIDDINIKIKNIVLKYPDLYQTKELDKGRIILSEGTIANNIYYVINGIIKAFVVNEKTQKYSTITFFSKDEFIIPYKSIVENVPSLVNLQVIKKSNLFVLDKLNIEKIKQKESELTDLLHKSTILTMYKFINYIANVHSYDNPTRYKLALKEMPYLEDVTNEEMAMYLGVDRTAISRYRKK